MKHQIILLYSFSSNFYYFPNSNWDSPIHILRFFDGFFPYVFFSKIFSPVANIIICRSIVLCIVFKNVSAFRSRTRHNAYSLRIFPIIFPCSKKINSKTWFRMACCRQSLSNFHVFYLSDNLLLRLNISSHLLVLSSIPKFYRKINTHFSVVSYNGRAVIHRITSSSRVGAFVGKKYSNSWGRSNASMEL